VLHEQASNGVKLVAGVGGISYQAKNNEHGGKSAWA